ncbi:metal-sensing transcriptional repressor [Sulfurospirillum arcachonense]|uniref:metal-sensing transcriptional repressor n=1 Tax=Sulfurospirillum arcachonense TaxID=57666 RepID=UPI000469AEBF|nr:metal-sensing transcriptional repressor [Sulfurospirillum arcachonense]
MAYCCDVERKKLINRINRISGQINSIKVNITDENNRFDEDPYEVVRQLTAVKGALNGMINSYVEHFAKGHLVEKIKSGNSIEAEAQVDNLLEIIKVFGK